MTTCREFFELQRGASHWTDRFHQAGYSFVGCGDPERRIVTRNCRPVTGPKTGRELIDWMERARNKADRIVFSQNTLLLPKGEPCPECGAPHRLDSQGVWGWSVMCSNCFDDAPDAPGKYFHGNTRAQAIEAWNEYAREEAEERALEATT